MELGDINAFFYHYIRGSVLILCIYNLLVFTQNKNKQFLYYSLYFLCILLFFIGQNLFSAQNMHLFRILTPTIHCGTFIFYLSFAREVLQTKIHIPNWDRAMLAARRLTLAAAFLFILVYLLFGLIIQSKLFLVLSFTAFIFTICSYYHFYKFNTIISKLFLLGSFLYAFLSMLSFFSGFVFNGYQGFIARFGIHPTFFMYLGAVVEALVFSLLIGQKITILENEKKETLYRLEKLKGLVVKNHIVLKDKTKIYISDLMYVKAEDHYLKLFLNTGKQHLVRGKLKEIKGQLPPNFVQSHRSYIVNFNFIKQATNSTVQILNGEQLPISRTFKGKF